MSYDPDYPDPLKRMKDVYGCSDAPATVTRVDAMFCEHASECPVACPCPERCYCKAHTCRERKVPRYPDGKYDELGTTDRAAVDKLASKLQARERLIEWAKGDVYRQLDELKESVLYHKRASADLQSKILKLEALLKDLV